MEFELSQNHHSPCPAGFSPPGWARCWEWAHQSRAERELLVNVGERGGQWRTRVRKMWPAHPGVAFLRDLFPYNAQNLVILVQEAARWFWKKKGREHFPRWELNKPCKQLRHKKCHSGSVVHLMHRSVSHKDTSKSLRRVHKRGHHSSPVLPAPTIIQLGILMSAYCLSYLVWIYCMWICRMAFLLSDFTTFCGKKVL